MSKIKDIVDTSELKLKVKEVIKPLKQLEKLINRFERIDDEDVNSLMYICSDLQYISGICVPSRDFDTKGIYKNINSAIDYILEQGLEYEIY